MPKLEYGGEDTLRLDYWPQSVRGERRAFGIDLRSSLLRTPLLSGNVTICFEDHVGSRKELDMPIGVASTLHGGLGLFLSDPIVREQALNGRPDSADELEAHIREMLRG